MKERKKNKGESLKNVVFALLVSFSIWIFSILNSEYSISIKVPLNIVTPEKFSISGKIPEKIDVLVSGVGWQILNLAFLPKTSNCNIIIDQSELINKQIIITKNDFIRGINLGINAKIIDVSPGSLLIEIGKMAEKVVPIELNISITPREHFVVVGTPVVKPEFVTIRGPSEVIDKIDKWHTSKVFLDDVSRPLQIEVPLSDTLHSQISKSLSKVLVYVDVDFAAEKTIYDIPVRIEGGNLPEGHLIEPKYVTATIRSGVNKIIETDLVTLDAKIFYNQIINDSIGIIKPHIEVPKGTTLIGIDPPYLYHSKIINSR